MSHSPHARAAHVRHANRAGGFGNGLGITFPGFGLPTGGAGGLGGGLGGDTSTSSSSTSTTSSSTSTTSAAPSTQSPSSSSSSSSSSSTSSTSSTTSTTTTTTAQSVTTTYSATALHQTMNMTVTHFTAETAAVAAPAPSNSAPSTTNALVAPVVGGVAGGVLGLAGIIFLITFFLRRRRPQEDAINFDPGAFRRSAMPISDPPTHQDIIARGYNPSAPPATMVQRAPMYPNPANYSNYDYPIDSNSPTSGNPLVFEAPFSPITSPGMSSPVAAYDRPWGAPAPVLTRSGSGSSAHQEPLQYPAPPNRQNSLRAPESEYLDLERGTSVTPFQAAQYVEISKHLNTEVPKGLDTPTVDTIVAEKMDADLPPLPSKEDNPFDDDAAAAPEVPDLPMVQELSFPSPPSPVHTTSFSRHSPRVDSTPPMLPEIVLQARVSVASTYLSPAPSTSEFPDGQTLMIKGQGPFGESPMGSRFPVTPSPLASSFSVVTPPPAQSSFPATPEPAANAQTQPQARPDAKKRQSVYTVYDPEDAYGGI
ncbi:hypothetical protein C8F04DRAFT_510306 [Mycena alexandri]|uniref:Uncharacterized protein n=1 Tax=Mycena alexandri TaxID=1745969 RepID=A0AAD6SXK2_9AGAR|nr:hypothetical protein C8F04DRAFT_510306 [Mycena alexandri]